MDYIQHHCRISRYILLTTGAIFATGSSCLPWKVCQ